MDSRVTDIKKSRRETAFFRAISELLSSLMSMSSAIAKVYCTKVSLSADGSSLFVYLFSDDGEDGVRKAIEDLKLYRRSMRASLSSMLESRRTPDIRFCYDALYVKQKKIEMLLDKIKSEE